MKKIQLLSICIISLLLFISENNLYAQCSTGEVEVEIDVITDNFGYELYWELLPAGNSCGSGTIFSGGNTAVGCNGGGVKSQAPGGYANSTTVTEGPWCLTDGNNYNLFMVDDWGDGGSQLHVKVEGFPVYEFTSQNTDELFLFSATAPPLRDAEMGKISTPQWVELGDVQIRAIVKNSGQNTITSLDLVYIVNSGSSFTGSITGLSIAPFESSEVTHTIPWTPFSTGLFTVVVQVANVNGLGADENASNNSNSKFINVKEPIPNMMPSYELSFTDFTKNDIAGSADQIDNPNDLDFHPNGELWIVNPATENTGGNTVTISDPNEAGQTSLWRKDANSWHFMSLPSGIAFSDNENFATSPAVFDANHDGGLPFTGPALWSSDSAIYAQPSGGNGSHLDMLHESPYSMGIAHEKDNVFWIFDAYTNDIVRYDFVDDHGPGNDYHGDAIVRRYPELAVNWIDQATPSHLELYKETGWLYIVDGGNQRVLRMDINSGTIGGTPAFPPTEALAEYSNVTGVNWEVVVSTGLTEPVGIDVFKGYMVVSDYANGDLIFYDITSMPAAELGRIQTGDAGITGVVVGPDGMIWYTNKTLDKVSRVVPNQIAVEPPPVGIASIDPFELSIYPVPADEMINVERNSNLNEELTISLIDIVGKDLRTYLLSSAKKSLQINVEDLPAGTYVLSVHSKTNQFYQKIIVN